MEIKIVQKDERFKRGMRKPRLDAAGGMIPYHLYPMAVHPVLPGETLKNAYWNFTIASDPLAHRLPGAWFDTWLFYVKATQLSNAAELVNMFVDGTALTPDAAADAPFFHAAGGVNYTKRAYEQVVKWYFRDADEALTPAVGSIGGIQPVKVSRKGWWDNLKLESATPTADSDLIGEAIEMPENVPAGFTDHWTQWLRMKELGLTTATYEDYLKAQGVNVPTAHEYDEEQDKPELLRHVPEWAFPVNTVNPATGVPATAHYFRLTDSADKDRFFKEPGFLVMVGAYRPKVYLGNLDGTMAHFMDKYSDWSPANLRDAPFTALHEFATATGPAPEAFGQDVWVDMRDYLLHGEQLAIGGLTLLPNPVPLPRNTTDTKYLSAAEARSMFVDTTNGRTYVDGTVQFNIASPISKDMTP